MEREKGREREAGKRGKGEGKGREGKGMDLPTAFWTNQTLLKTAVDMSLSTTAVPSIRL